MYVQVHVVLIVEASCLFLISQEVVFIYFVCFCLFCFAVGICCCLPFFTFSCSVVGYIQS